MQKGLVVNRAQADLRQYFELSGLQLHTRPGPEMIFSVKWPVSLWAGPGRHRQLLARTGKVRYWGGHCLGSLMMNRLPRPGAELTLMAPPCCLMI